MLCSGSNLTCKHQKHTSHTRRAEVRGTMANLRQWRLKKWKNTKKYSDAYKHLLQVMEVYHTSARVGCTCTIFSKKKVAKMFESAEAFNQEALTGVTQKCECENEKTERSRDVFNEAMEFVGVVSFFPRFSKGE